MVQNRWRNASFNLTHLTKIETAENNLVVQLDLSVRYFIETEVIRQELKILRIHLQGPTYQ